MPPGDITGETGFRAACRRAWRDSAWLRTLAGLAVAVVVWWHSPTVLQDVLVFGSLLWVLIFRRNRLHGWTSPVGLGFILLLAHMLAMLSFSVHPALSLRDLTRQLDLVAGMIAIPALFDTPRRLQHALFFSAGALALGFGYDLVRLGYRLGGRILERAHAYEPFLQNHSNVASMMAGAAAFVFFYFFWLHRRRFWPAVAGLAGLTLSLAYLVVLASRGPQIAFAAACCLPGFLAPGRRAKAIWTLLVLLGGGLLVLGAGAINPRLRDKASMGTFTERTVVWEHTWKLAQAHPALGYGYGKQTFEAVYYGSRPPRSSFHYPHCHQYWLKLRFEFGWLGVALYAGVWGLLAVSLWRHTFRLPTFTERLLPGTIGMCLAFIHLYGLGDYPDNVVEIMQYALAAAAVGVLAMPPPATASPPRTPGQ
jgi:O-antigen ligase